MIETPRLLKKPDGSRKRVENQDELDAALKDGWFVRLPVAEAAPVVESAEAVAAEPDAPADEPDASETVDEDAEPEDAEPDAPRKRGRPRKTR